MAGAVADPLADDDLQLALYLCLELHYRSFPGVADDWEWDPSLLAIRQSLERPFLDRLEDIGAPAAILNAVNDGLRDTGIELNDTPISVHTVAAALSRLTMTTKAADD